MTWLGATQYENSWARVVSSGTKISLGLASSMLSVWLFASITSVREVFGGLYDFGVDSGQTAYFYMLKLYAFGCEVDTSDLGVWEMRDKLSEETSLWTPVQKVGSSAYVMATIPNRFLKWFNDPDENLGAIVAWSSNLVRTMTYDWTQELASDMSKNMGVSLDGIKNFAKLIGGGGAMFIVPVVIVGIAAFYFMR